ncbi:MAG TPA: sorbosone dehydrogenase family protein [Candidatus Limnocylindrales bacterium]|nr:sorbosone dehydrogenase family protein [Candidatus Limnocylindrales bacterium]
MNISKLIASILLGGLWLAAIPAAAQVTYGKKPSLPPPFATKSAGNGPERVKPPEGFLPTVPAGFHINIFAIGFKVPRFLATAPNGDIFVADTGAGEIDVLRDPQRTGGAQQREVFADKLNRPFGIAFREDYVYVGNTNEVVRFRYDKQTSKRTSEAEHILDLPPGGGHFTRTIAFSLDGTKLYVSVGSSSNLDFEKDQRRAAVLVSDPDGKNSRVYASGLRNAVGLGIEPVTGAVWVSVNERDELGDDLPPDYFTSIKDGGFYGWPYSYIGSNVDPRVSPQKPELVAQAIIPDVLLGPHVAPLQFAFYTGKQFPEQYRGGAFIAEHGSWNRAVRNGYQVAFVGFKNGKAAADPVPFLTGLVPDPNGPNVNGRPVGVTVAADGSLLVSDDGAGVIYRVSYAK